MQIQSTLVLLLTPALLLAQPSAASVAAQFEAFKQERAAANVPAEALTTADNLAKMAEAAQKAESTLAASRLIRDARWSIPAKPFGLPEGVRVFGLQRLRSGDRVNSVRYNADGTNLLTTSADRTVRVYDVANGREIIVYSGHTPANTDEPPTSGIAKTVLRVPDAAFHPDGKRVASAGGKQIHLWDLATGKTLATITGPTKLVKSIAFNDDGSKLAACSDDLIVRVFETDTGKEIFTGTAHSARIEQVAFQPKGKYVAAVDIDGFLSVYDPTGKNKAPLMKAPVSDGGTLPAYAVCFTPDGTKILTGGGDKVPRLTAAPAPDGTLPQAGAALKLAPHTDEVRGVDVTADGKFFVSGGKDRTVRVADGSGTLIRQFGGLAGEITAVAVRPDGRQVAAASDNGAVKVWDLDTVDEHRSLPEAKSPLWATAVTADGSRFATAGADKTIRVYSGTGKLEASLTGSTAAVTSLAFLPNGKLLSAGGDKLLREWDVATGKESGTWTGHAAAILALATKPDGKLVVSGAADKTVIGWNPETGKALWTWTARSVVAALAVPNDGPVIVGTADGGISVLRIEGDKVTVAAFVNGHVSGVAAMTFSRDSRFFASVGGDGRPKLWSFNEKGAPIAVTSFNDTAAKTIISSVALSALAISPDNAWLATGGADRVVRLWSLNSGQESRMLRGPTDWVTALAFVSDARLVAVGADAVARIFELPQTHETTAIGHGMKARAAIWSADGKAIFSVGDDRAVRQWNAGTGVETAVIQGATDRLFSVGLVGANLLAAGGDDRRLRLWTLPDNAVHTTTPLGKVYGVFPAADGKRLGVWSQAGDRENSYEIFDVTQVPPPVSPGAASRLKAITMAVEKQRTVKAATLAPNLERAASGDDTGAVQLWNLATGAKDGAAFNPFKEPGALPEGIGGLVGGAAPPAKGEPMVIADLGFSADAKKLAVINHRGEIRIVSLGDGKVVAQAVGPENGVNSLVAATKADRFAVLGTERTVQVFDFAGKELKSWTLPTMALSANFSADGQQLLAANADGSLVVLVVP